MNASALKIVVPLVLLLAVIFAVTFFSQYKEPEDDGGAKGAEKVENRPLRFFSSTRMWTPDPNASLMDQAFQGYFETADMQSSANYWFENRNPQPVMLEFLRVTCTACSEGEVATIPPDVSKQILQMTAISMLPHGLVTPLPLAMAVPAAQLDDQRGVLQWQSHKFNERQGTIKYEIPGATTGDPWVEPWGILRLGFKIGGRNYLSAGFGTHLKGSEKYFEGKFVIQYELTEPFYLNAANINFGEMTGDSPPKRFDIIAYSATKTPAHVGKFSADVRMLRGAPGEPGPFIAAGAPELIPDDQYLAWAAKVGRRVLSAYRIPITVKVKDGPRKLDIGPVERLISITQGNETKHVELHGILHGPVVLAHVLRELNFDAFDYSMPQRASIQIESERNGVELEIVNELTQPKLLKVELTRQPDIGDRGIYKLTVSIPAKEQYGEFKDAVVVLQTKGPNPQKLRIPVAGRGKD